MNELKQTYNNLKLQLQDVTEQLHDPATWLEIQEKERQLQAIEKTVQQMKKSGINIPTEMTEVKLRLVKELEHGQELHQLRSNIVELLISTLEDLGYDLPKEEHDVKKKHKKTTSKSRRISLEHLFKAGLLHDGMSLHHYGRDGNYEGVIKDGKLVIKNGHTVLEFDSPSAAAIEVTGGSRNGWTFWCLNYHNKIVFLDTIRKAYKKA